MPVSLGQGSFKRALKDEKESFHRKMGLLSSRNGPREGVKVSGLRGGGCAGGGSNSRTAGKATLR